MSIEEPKVYIATYSSTDVYECTINNSPIMRRCKDDWVNATQILKCCNFPKAKRTKILEKGVQQGLHEKIQGGYGRFQGTWIPLPNAQKLAASYGVTPDIAPVLYLDPTDPNIVIPKKTKQLNKDGTPVKRKYTKKAKPLEQTPSKKAKFDPPQPQTLLTSFSPKSSFGTLAGGGAPPQLQQMSVHKNGGPPPPPSQMPYHSPTSSQQMVNAFTQADFLAMSGNNMPSMSMHNQAIQNEFQNYQLQFQRFQQSQGQQMQPKMYPTNMSYTQMSGGVPQQAQMLNQFGHVKVPLSQSTNETTWSQDDRQKDSDTSLSSADEQFNNQIKSGMNLGTNIGESLRTDENYYASHLLKFFGEDNPSIPYFIHNPPYDFDMNEPIDDEGHTPLHWAASIGNSVMIHLLITKGANPLVVNNFGLNPLSKLVSFNNCFELKNFPKILDDLELCLVNTDINGRTPLHYICQFSKVKSKYESLKYYLSIILSKLTSLSKSSYSNSVNLLKNVIDHQDVNGDTCLHLAARSKSSKMVKFLLSYGARDDLINVNNETAKYLMALNDLIDKNYVDERLSLSQFQVENALTTSENRGSPNPQHGTSNQALTPVQQSYGAPITETPDTQRTTVQDEDEEEEDLNVARVNKDQIERLDRRKVVSHQSDENKENVFVDDGMKSYYSMSTPLPNKSHANLHSGPVSLSHQPLAVISERPVEGTPSRVDDKLNLLASASPQVYKPCPPKLSEEGNLIVEKHDEDVSDKVSSKLPMTDFSSMVNGMINSLSESYRLQISQLTSDCKKLKLQLQNKQEEQKLTFNKLKVLLQKCGIATGATLDENKAVVYNEIKRHEEEVHSKQQLLFSGLEKQQQRQLEDIIQQANGNTDDICFKSDYSWEVAVHLTKLQLKRKSLSRSVTEKIKNFGIDPKMYKYRKLISLSCGLKVEDIDGLIEGIEESLMETSLS